MKKKLFYSVLALTLFALACKEDDNPPTGQIDKAKVTSLLKKADIFEDYVFLPMDVDLPTSSTLGKITRNRVFGADFDFGEIGGVIPIVKQTTDGYRNYEYDFDNDATVPSPDYDGKMTIRMNATLSSLEIIYVQFKDNTMKDEQGKPVTNSVNGNLRLTFDPLSGSDSYKTVINSDLTVMVAGKSSTIKFKDFSNTETHTQSETNGVMELISGSESYAFEFTTVVETPSCELLPVSGKLKITPSNPAEALEIDYGTGACDKKVTVKYNGVTEEILLD